LWRWARPAAALPCLAYQQIRIVSVSIMNGTVRSTALGSRFWASPTPSRSLPSLMVCSIDHRLA
jgi:hypothetical protein